MVSEFLEKRDELKSRLLRLPKVLRAAFGAACAERLVPSYADYCANNREEPVLVPALADVWRLVLGSSGPDVGQLLVKSDEWKKSAVPKVGIAQGAALAILYAVRAIAVDDPNDDSAFYAADCVTNALVENIKNNLGITDYGPSYQDNVLKHAAVIQEIERQWGDVAALEGALDGSEAITLEAIRARAVEERIRPLPVTELPQTYINPFTHKPMPRRS